MLIAGSQHSKTLGANPSFSQLTTNQDITCYNVAKLTSNNETQQLASGLQS